MHDTWFRKQLVGIIIFILVFQGAVIGISTTKIIGTVDGKTVESPLYEYDEEYRDSFTCSTKMNTQSIATPFKNHVVYRSTPRTTVGSESGLLFVLVEAQLYDSLTDALEQYASDVEDEGYTVQIHTISGGDPQAIRTLLYENMQYDLVGCVLVGDIPSVWCESDLGDSPEIFPMDYYYMDLNGQWEDTDNDGYVEYEDPVSDEKLPEIWVGRLKADTLSGDRVELLQNYFYKNHQYRLCAPFQPARALVYIDDEFALYGTEDMNGAVSLVYNDRNVVVNNETTNADDYKSQITQDYEWIKLATHSSSQEHLFQVNGQVQQVKSSDIRSIDPTATFYDLFCTCYTARYIEPDYIAGWYIFGSHGLIAIGSTAQGKALGPFLDNFYTPLHQGKTIGEAFKNCIIHHGTNPLFLYFGYAILGDPTLSPLSQGITRRPNQPDQPTGPPNGNTGVEYTYTVTTIDPDSDQVSYFIDWGDGTTTGWFGWYDSGVPVNAHHTWNTTGTYQLRVRAKDTYGADSRWSDPLSVSIPKNKRIGTLGLSAFLMRLIERVPLLETLLEIPVFRHGHDF